MFSDLLNLLRYWDISIFNFINGFAGRWQVLDYAGIFFAKYFEYILLLFFILFLAVNFKKYWKMVLSGLIAAFFVRFVLVEAIRLLKFRARPFVNSDVNLLLAFDPLMASFPSGHASFYFALSTIIYGYSRKIGGIFYIAAFLIAVSRVFVGIHWPVDILAGAFFGIVTGIFLNFLFKNMRFGLPVDKNSTLIDK